MITKSAIRHACYRKKNDQPSKQHLINLVSDKIPQGESWDTFADKWDILLNKDGEVKIIKPETDYDYIHSVCLEVSLYKRKGIELDFDDRAMNVVQTVDLNMLNNMTWEDYNKTWGVFIDHELKRIHTKHFKTVQNVVTDKMIDASQSSDGAAMTSTPSIPSFAVEMKPFEPSDTEKALLAKLSKSVNK